VLAEPCRLAGVEDVAEVADRAVYRGRNLPARLARPRVFLRDRKGISMNSCLRGLRLVSGGVVPESAVFWPVCLLHGDVPLRSIAGWSYCDGVGWHDEDGAVVGEAADLAVFELSIERLFARLNPGQSWLAVI
jgi:hypothetical protein